MPVTIHHLGNCLIGAWIMEHNRSVVVEPDYLYLSAMLPNPENHFKAVIGQPKKMVAEEIIGHKFCVLALDGGIEQKWIII